MKKPNIELKNVKEFQGRDWGGLNADLYLDGKKIAFVLDEGNGGEMDIDAVGKTKEEREKNQQLLNGLEAYAKTLPKVDMGKVLTGVKEENRFADMDLEMLINEIVDERNKAKAVKQAKAKMQKQMAKAILYGVPNANQYMSVTFKHPIAVIKAQAPDVLTKHVEAIKAKLGKGEVIFNTNL